MQRILKGERKTQEGFESPPTFKLKKGNSFTLNHMSKSIEELSIENLGILVCSSEVINRRYKRVVVRPTDRNQDKYCGPVAIAIVMHRQFSEVNQDLKSGGFRKNDKVGSYSQSYVKNLKQDNVNLFQKVTDQYPRWKTVAAFTRNVKKGRFMIHVDRHFAAVVDGVLYNTLYAGRRARVQDIYQYVGKR